MRVVVIVLLVLLFSPSTIERGRLVAVASEVEISQLLLLPQIKIDIFLLLLLINIEIKDCFHAEIT